MSVRTRFAPSPTGSLHLGNVRVAVFNHLFARRHGGAFVLRIEDTDEARTVAGSEASILEDLRWLGLDWDEGPDVGGPHGPYRQSERGAVYREAAEALLASGLAYRCGCGEGAAGGGGDEGPDGREGWDPAGDPARGGEAGAAGPGCAGGCRGRHVAPGDGVVVRFAVPEGPAEVEVQDEVRGVIAFPRNDLNDFVILRPDGRPTYNFAVVVDDADMEISHVIRGAGHLSNTHKQAVLFDALGRPRPVFAHLPTVLAPGGGKLSKRTGAPAVRALREAGYHPDGVVNYLSLLGWSSPDGEEVLDRDALAGRIGLDRVGAADTAFDPEKLRWLSGRHLAAMPAGDLAAAAAPFVERARAGLDHDALRRAVEALRTRLSTLADVAEHLPLLHPETRRLSAAREAVADDPAAEALLGALRSRLEAVDPWTAEAVEGEIRGAGKEAGLRGRALFHPVRAALTAAEQGPALGEVAAALGRAETLRRLGPPGS